MLPQIEVGREYTLRPTPNPEYRCLACDRMVYDSPGWSQWAGLRVRVLANVSGQVADDGRPGDGGPGCHQLMILPEGMYIVFLGGEYKAVPFPWLEPIPEQQEERDDTD
jgi:hypothetical protein